MKRKPIPNKVRRAVYDKYNGHCAYCGCKLECKDMQVDHIESVYMAVECLDKEVDDSLKNYMPSCKSCNYYKNTGTIEDFRERIKNTLEHTCIDTFQARLAMKYGIIEFKPWNSKFYFETVKEETK